jgi:hypothetical protein
MFTLRIKTLPAHRLAGAHRLGAPYSSRRAPRCGRPRNEASRRFGVGRVKTDARFEQPLSGVALLG